MSRFLPQVLASGIKDTNKLAVTREQDIGDRSIEAGRADSDLTDADKAVDQPNISVPANTVNSAGPDVASGVAEEVAKPSSVRSSRSLFAVSKRTLTRAGTTTADAARGMAATIRGFNGFKTLSVGRTRGKVIIGDRDGEKNDTGTEENKALYDTGSNTIEAEEVSDGVLAKDKHLL
jgi:hypothetical protein